MRKVTGLVAALAIGIGVYIPTSAQVNDTDPITWGQFRGPNGTGVYESEISAPIEWNKEKNMKWQVDLPGPGSSSPIILEDKVYLTCYTGYGLDKETPGNVSELKRHLLCLNRNDGSEVWRATVDSDHDEEAYKGFIQEHGYASSTPVTDGNVIYTFFGKTGVVAFDLEGKQLWKTNVGTQSDPMKWGGGASAVLVGDVLIVNAGTEGRAVYGLNKSDGKELWKVEDDSFGNSWTTPTVVEVNGRTETVFSMPGKIIAIDPASGDELWTATSPVAQTTCASLALNGDIVYAMGGRTGRAIAVKCGGSGDVSETQTQWEGSLAAGIGTPILANGRLYWNSRGIVYCANPENGELFYKERLKSSSNADAPEQSARTPAGDYASPIALGDHVYLTARSGQVFVIDASSENFKQLADNSFEGDDSLFNASPAVADGELYFRSDKCLYCIAKE